MGRSRGVPARRARRRPDRAAARSGVTARERTPFLPMSAENLMGATVVRRGAARRAVLRWTWRLFRREWRQQLLTVCVLTVAVAGAVWASTASVNSGSKARAMLG